MLISKVDELLGLDCELDEVSGKPDELEVNISVEELWLESEELLKLLELFELELWELEVDDNICVEELELVLIATVESLELSDEVNICVELDREEVVLWPTVEPDEVDMLTVEKDDELLEFSANSNLNSNAFIISPGAAVTENTMMSPEFIPISSTVIPMLSMMSNDLDDTVVILLMANVPSNCPDTERYPLVNSVENVILALL